MEEEGALSDDPPLSSETILFTTWKLLKYTGSVWSLQWYDRGFNCMGSCDMHNIIL
jgi:hypothetical protein